jgi:hypothetical protein
MTGPELFSVPGHIVCIWQVAVDEKKDATILDGQVIASDSPEKLRLLSSTEAIDVDECGVAAAYPRRRSDSLVKEPSNCSTFCSSLKRS